mmetsp:Transcript_14097/g.33829  ORF Transcript_14097/g.33829 Transcript_14097/m.33829 type:complete len:227 (-) Transcript_14097:1523-2203(-)
MFSRRSRRPSMLHASTTLSCSGAFFIRSWKSALIMSKRLESSGSCTRMSAEPTNTDSSMLHFLDTSPHTVSVLSTVPIFFCHPLTSSRNLGLPCTYLEPLRFCSARLSFSSVSWMMSSTISDSTSESGKGVKLRLRLAHVSSIFFSCFSITSSFCARSTISLTASTHVCSSSASRSPRLNFSSMTKCLPVARMSCFQWRSRMSGDRRSATSGTDTRKFFTASSSPT